MFQPLFLGHHQARDEYKHQLIELCLSSNMDSCYVLTSFFLHNFRINSQAIKVKIKIKN
jgi:hypothetical protein